MSDNKKPWLLDGEMYQYNLGWLIDKILSFESDLATAIDLKTIKYADPIQWDITTQYTANTVVIDPKTGVAYMSKVPVPAGVDLDNANYWVKVFDFLSIYNRIMDGIATNERRNDYASKDYSVNDLVWYSEKLYRVTSAITEGAKFIPGTNLTETTIDSCLERYYGKDRFAQVSNDTLNVSGDYTINAGDITETADNKTVSITNDFTADVKDNLNVSIGGNSTLTFSDGYMKALKQLGVDVKSYGAKGDGATDDSEAFIKAFNKSRIIYVPPGSYKIPSAVFPENFIVSSDGEILTPLTLNVTGVFKGGLYHGITASAGITVSGITSKVANGSAIHATGGIVSITNSDFTGSANVVLVENSTNALIENCIATCLTDTSKLHCFQLNGCTDSSMKNCVAKNANWFGFSVYNSFRCAVIDCQSVDSYAEGINLENSSSGIVTGCQLSWDDGKSHDYGLSVFGNNEKSANLNQITNNVIYNCLQSGIAVDGNAASNTVIDNLIINCTNGAGIRQYALNCSKLENYTGKPGGNIFKNNTILPGSACKGLYREESIDHANFLDGNYSTIQLNSGVYESTFPGANIGTDTVPYTFTCDNGAVTDSFIAGINPKCALIQFTINVTAAKKTTVTIPFTGTSLIMGTVYNGEKGYQIFNDAKTLFFTPSGTGVMYGRAIVILK